MPYTKRIAHKGTMKDLLEYTTDPDKTDNGLLVTGVNCHSTTALTEFKNTNNKFHNKGGRVGYHLIQSFCPLDKITPEQANEIGVRLCKEIYPEFQCVVSTHVDRGHIHNHIAINAINLNGRKLEDKLSNKKEGMYGYKEASDRISKEYGCYIMPPFELNKSTAKKSGNYRFYKHQTWRNVLAEDVKQAKLECNSLEEFIYALFDLGYDIKYGKYISIKPQGKERFVRLKSISEDFSEENLRNYFAGHSIKYDNKYKSFNSTDYNEELNDYYEELKTAINVTSTVAIKNGEFPVFEKTKNRAKIQTEQVEKVLELLDKENINSYDDLENKLRNYRHQQKQKNIEIKILEKKNANVVESVEKAQTFILLHKDYEYAQFYSKQDKNYQMPDFVSVYEELKAELNISTVDEAKEIIANCRNVRLQLNSLKTELYDIEQKSYNLDLLKEEQLIKSGLFVHNLKMGNNRIDYSNSNDDEWCFQLPYSNYYIKVSKTLTSFNHKYNYNTVFLIDDKPYQIYKKDENGNLKALETVTGEQIDNYVSQLKDQSTEKHK